jgi:hypothetical protein
VYAANSLLRPPGFAVEPDAEVSEPPPQAATESTRAAEATSSPAIPRGLLILTGGTFSPRRVDKTVQRNPRTSQ